VVSWSVLCSWLYWFDGFAGFLQVGSLCTSTRRRGRAGPSAPSPGRRSRGWVIHCYPPLLCSVWCIGLWYYGGELVAMFVLYQYWSNCGEFVDFNWLLAWFTILSCDGIWISVARAICCHFDLV
jgi:hypothetical protein